MRSLAVHTESAEGLWPRVKIGECCDPRIETVVPEATPEEEFTYVDISAVDASAKRITAPKKLKGRQASSRARQRLRTGDVLVSTVRPNLNAVAMVGAELDGAVGSTGFCVLRAKPDLDPEFLFGWVRTREFVESLSALVAGAMYPAVSDKQVRAQEIPFPAFKKQRYVAGRLREKFHALDCGRTALLDQLDGAQKLPAAILCEAFAGEKSAKWSRAQLGDVIVWRNEIVHPRDLPKGRTVFVGLEHIESNTGRRIGSVSIDLAKLTGRKARFYRDDLVYGYLRPYLNKLWVADSDGCCSVDQYVFTVRTELADPGFVAHFMRSEAYLKTAPVGHTPGQLPRIRIEEVAAVPIPLPDLETQRVIAAKLHRSLEHAENLRAGLSAQLAALDRYPAALLRDAFAGRL